MEILRFFVRGIRQRFKLYKVPFRPVLDIINFGSLECVILDVGACEVGFAGEILLRAPLSTVHCFEPNKHLCKVLREKAKQFGKDLRKKSRCIVVEAGVGEKKDKKNL